MRPLALVLALVLPAYAWQPPKAPEVRRFISAATSYHRTAGTLDGRLRDEIRQHAWDAWEASRSGGRRHKQDAASLFRVYASTAMLESRARVPGTHDGGRGLGPVSITEGELDAAAYRAGMLRRGASAESRRRLLERAWRDRTLLVHLSVEHISHRIAFHGGVRAGLDRNSGAKSERTRIAYMGTLLWWHDWLWGELLPVHLARTPTEAVGSPASSSQTAAP